MKRPPIVGLEHSIEVLVNIIDVVLNQFKETSCLALAIAGGSCSGKSLLADKLKEALEVIGVDVSVLNFDDYYKDRSDPTFPFDGEGKAIFDLPQSYLLDEFRDHVEILLSGESIISPKYDKKTHKRLPGLEREVKPASVIISEGLFVVETLRDLNDTITIFVETSKDIRIARRIKRDTGKLHDTEAETIAFIEQRVEPYYQKYVATQKDLASVVIINND